MSNRRKLQVSGESVRNTSIPVFTLSVRRWQIRIHVSEPWLIDDAEIMDRQDFRDVMERCMVSASRASFMVNGPNREVWWGIDLWDRHRGVWGNVCNGKSKLKDRPTGVMPREIA